MVHLEIKSADKRSIPITETGYRSHFIQGDSLAEHGGALAFVMQWLEHDAARTGWTRHHQMSLFD